jgi:urease accessory protein
MQGDDYNLRIILEPGAKVVLVNQSASKIHQMREGQAKQSVHITLAEDAELEYYPGLTIPFPEANYEQEIKIDMTSGAKLALLERWATGRVARGESYLFHSLGSQLRLYRDSQLIYADRTILKRDTGMLDANTYLASGVWVWDSIPGAEAVPEDMVLITGQSIKQVGYVRGMARDGLKMQQALDTMLLTWRKQQGLEDIVFSRFMS